MNIKKNVLGGLQTFIDYVAKVWMNTTDSTDWHKKQIKADKRRHGLKSNLTKIFIKSYFVGIFLTINIIKLMQLDNSSRPKSIATTT